MKESQIADLSSWLVESGLRGIPEIEIVEGFCERAIRLGAPLKRAVSFLDTLHPIHEGRAFRWERGEGPAKLIEYGRTVDGEASERWTHSPPYRQLAMNENMLRRRVVAGPQPEFPAFVEFAEVGITDYVSIIRRFDAENVIGGMDCYYAQWMTDCAEGFQRRGHRRARTPDAVPGSRAQVRGARRGSRKRWSRPT